MSGEWVKVTFLAVFAAMQSAAWGHPAPESGCDKHRVSEFQFTGENDVLVPFNASDGEYTNGLRFNWTYSNGCAPRWMGAGAKKTFHVSGIDCATSSIRIPYRRTTTTPWSWGT